MYIGNIDILRHNITGTYGISTTGILYIDKSIYKSFGVSDLYHKTSTIQLGDLTVDSKELVESNIETNMQPEGNGVSIANVNGIPVLNFSGTGSVISDSVLNCALDNSDFTIGFWAYRTSTGLTDGLVSFADNTANYALHVCSDFIGITSSSGGGNGLLLANGPVSDYNNWTYIEISRLSGIFYVFKNGALLTSVNGSTYNLLATRVAFGTRYTSPGLSSVWRFQGYMTAITINKGQATNTVSYTVNPTPEQILNKPIIHYPYSPDIIITNIQQTQYTIDTSYIDPYGYKLLYSIYHNNILVIKEIELPYIVSGQFQGRTIDIHLTVKNSILQESSKSTYTVTFP